MQQPPDEQGVSSATTDERAYASGGAVSLQGTARSRLGDKVFRGISTGAGILILVIMAAIAAFLIAKAIPALRDDKTNFLTTKIWQPDAAKPSFGILVIAFGTVISALLAMILAVPVGIGVALFLSHYARPRVAAGLAFVVDLLAAVPSIVFGLWGNYWLGGRAVGVFRFMDQHFSWIPVFDNRLDTYTKSIALASVVLAIMIIPTISAISREVFSQVPTAHIEAALALGATRWEMVRTAVLPYGRPGIISSAMLGLGRALGETIAVAVILSSTFTINLHLTEPGGNTIAANIANTFQEAGVTGRGALIASGLVLFVITLIVNITARVVIARRREFSGAN
jgi:phosphate transport system permease protein